LARFSPRRCSICSHADRESINKAIVAQEPFRNIARRFDTSLSAVYRHHKAHLPKTLVKAAEAREVVHGEDLLGQPLTLRDKTMSILNQAEATGDLRVALYAIKEARGCLELVGKVTGELIERHAHLHRQDAPGELIEELLWAIKETQRLQQEQFGELPPPKLLTGEEAVPSAAFVPPVRGSSPISAGFSGGGRAL
jgi:hypothetical protein